MYVVHLNIQLHLSDMWKIDKAGGETDIPVSHRLREEMVNTTLIRNFTGTWAADRNNNIDPELVVWPLLIDRTHFRIYFKRYSNKY